MSCASVARPTTVAAMTQIVLRLTSGSAPIRGMRVEGRGNCFSVYDFMWNTGAYTSKGVVLKTFSRLISDGTDTQSEVKSICLYLKFPGPGQRETPCMTITGLQRLLCLLGGRIGQQYRDLATGTLTRVAAGDTSLIEEIEDNAASDAPVQQLAREALVQPRALPAAEDPAQLLSTGVEAINVERIERTTMALAAFKEEFNDTVTVLRESRSTLATELEMFKTRLLLCKEQLEIDKERAMLPDLRKRKNEEHTTHAINEFLSWPTERRKAMRPVLMSQLEEVIPVKRARTAFITGLMKVPAAGLVKEIVIPAPVPEAAQPADARPIAQPDAQPPVDDNVGVYVLQLANGRFYVGQSRNIQSRIARHRSGTGSAVASDPLAVQIPCVTPRPSPEDLEAWERAETLELMHQHGIDKVRGWIYNANELSPSLKAHAHQQICSRKNLCHRCGEPGHFTSQCTAPPIKILGSR